MPLCRVKRDEPTVAVRHDEDGNIFCQALIQRQVRCIKVIQIVFEPEDMTAFSSGGPMPAVIKSKARNITVGKLVGDRCVSSGMFGEAMDNDHFSSDVRGNRHVICDFGTVLRCDVAGLV